MKISIITTSYNYAEFIEETISSVLVQTYTNWELIIVDDFSTDNSVDIIQKYLKQDSRIKLIRHEQNLGLKQSILTGLEASSGQWVAFLESDDLFEPNYLEEKIKIRQQFPQAKLIFNDCEFFGDNSRVKKYNWALGFSRNKLLRKKFPQRMFYDLYLDNLIFTFSCVMVEKKLIERTNFNTPYDALLDWWLWIHLAFDNEFYYTPQKLTKWRLHPQSYILNSKKRCPTALQDMAYLDVAKKNKRLPQVIFYILISKILWILRWLMLRIRSVIVKIKKKILKN